MEISNYDITTNQQYVGQLDVSETTGVNTDHSVAKHAETMTLDSSNQSELIKLLGTDNKNAPKGEFESPQILRAAVFTRGSAVVSTGDLVVASGKVTQTQVSSEEQKAEQSTLNNTIEELDRLQSMYLTATGNIARLRQA
ncbi:MAG: hypothetical protein GWP59_07600 [Chlamydiales bacterium]|nr:hypothetical protein [Chlamydiales bacterium]